MSGYALGTGKLLYKNPSFQSSNIPIFTVHRLQFTSFLNPDTLSPPYSFFPSNDCATCMPTRRADDNGDIDLADNGFDRGKHARGCRCWNDISIAKGGNGH